MFRDEARIEVQAGKGGDGMASFRREAHVPKGGPDGGDGGDGGSVVLYATTHVNSLLAVGRTYHVTAPNGRPGGTSNRTGRRGEDVRVEVPVGTLVRDAEHGNLLCDLDHDGAEVVVARGGRGGKGNKRFANSVNQVPREAQTGRPGEHRTLDLELKLFAEVGLLGFPNAGKSTFLSRVTAARPKIADYPFTTLDPQVGIAQVGEYDTLVIADLPGLIEGAAEGHGLGHRFLKHVERCRVLLHLVDVSTTAEREPDDAWRALEDELRRASPELFAKPRLVVGTKHFEDPASEERLECLRAVVREERPEAEVLAISSVTGRGLDVLLERARVLVRGEGA